MTAPPPERFGSRDHQLDIFRNFGGGQVDITNGKFVFSACDAYMIENGRVTYPVNSMTVGGTG